MMFLEWIKENDALLAWSGVLGFLMFVVSIAAIPLIIAWMPEDYFVRISRKPFKRRPFRQVLRIFKNIFGLLLLLCGLILLLLPGQGILTIVIGISLIDFPGKHQLQLRLVRNPRIRQSIQWIRAKVHHKPLIIP
ncbi:MAG: PGPGW domain-containing protein [Puniceicoccaceae bacterium]